MTEMSCNPTVHVGHKAAYFCVALPVVMSILMLLRPGSLSELPAQGLDVEEWSYPIDLAAGRTGKSFYPVIISDTAGGAHVFWDETVEDRGVIKSWVDYAYWDGTTWSETIDVFIGTEEWQSAWGAQAIVDFNGVLHTIWIDGSSLKYAQRHVSSPVSARSWIGKMTLATTNGRIGPGAIALDDLGILHILYLDAGGIEPGVYYLRSENGGESWEGPILISEPGTAWSQAIQRYVFDLLPVGDTLHVAWIQDTKVFYARGLARGKEWSDPEMLQLSNWPSLVAFDDGHLLLLVTGNLPDDNAICFKLQNTSLDGGTTWNVQKILMPYIKGCLGLINVVRAYDGSYHLITSAYRPEEYPESPDEGRYGIWHSEWDGENWGVPRLASWPDVSYRTLGTQIDFPHATISEGNILHVVFHVDEGHIWYIRHTLPASRAPLVTFPTPATVVGNDADSAPTPTTYVVGEADSVTVDTSPKTPQPTPAHAVTRSLRQESALESRTPSTGNAMFLVVISLVPSAILVGSILAWSLGGRRRR